MTASLTLNVLGQDKAELSQQLCDQVNCRGIISYGFQSLKDSILLNEIDLFKMESVEWNTSYSKEFRDFLDKETEAQKSVTFVLMLKDFHDSHSLTEIQNHIESIDSTNIESAFDHTGLRNSLNHALAHEIPYLYNSIGLFFSQMRAQKSALNLKLTIDSMELTQAPELFALYLNSSIETELPLKILNPITMEISVPDDYDFNKMVSLTISHQNQRYVFNRYGESLPEAIREISSPLKPEYFKDLEFWMIDINDDRVLLKTKIQMSISR